MMRVDPLRSRRGPALAFTLGACTLCIAVLADAWTPAAQQPFSLPSGQKPGTPVWTGPANGRRVAVKVRTSSGAVRAQKPVGTPVGTVPANATCIWEGLFDSFTIEGVGPGTSTGFTVVSRQDDPGLGDRLIGAGMLTLPLPSTATSFTYYASENPLCRLTRVMAGGSSVNVTAAGVTLATVDAGDTCFCVRTTNSFGLSSAGSGTSELHVYDLVDGVPSWSYGGTATKQGPADTGDGFWLDGTGLVKVTLTNTSASGQVVIASSHPCTPSTTLQPGQTATASGPITSFQWTYQGDATAVSFQIANP